MEKVEESSLALSSLVMEPIQTECKRDTMAFGVKEVDIMKLSAQDPIDQIAFVIAKMLNELNEIVMPTSGTEPQELYHSNHDIDDAARYKVEHSDIPMASIIAQHDFRQKQMDVNDLSEDASVRSLVGSLSGQDEPKFQNQTHEIVNEKRNIVWKH